MESAKVNLVVFLYGPSYFMDNQSFDIDMGISYGPGDISLTGYHKSNL